MPGKSSSPADSIRRKLSRISCLTVLEVQPLSRSSLRLVGRADGGMTRFSPPGERLGGLPIILGNTCRLAMLRIGSPGRTRRRRAPEPAARRAFIRTRRVVPRGDLTRDLVGPAAFSGSNRTRLALYQRGDSH